MNIEINPKELAHQKEQELKNNKPNWDAIRAKFGYTDLKELREKEAEENSKEDAKK